MIPVPSPSMAVIDSRAAVTYQMDYTIRVQPSVTMSQIARAVIDRATAINRTIENLVLTAHGAPGFFQLGTGLDVNSMNPFHILRGNVKRIWFRGCLVGRIVNSQTERDGDWSTLSRLGLTSGNGHAFLSAFAQLTQCFVVAPTEIQASNRTIYPIGVMDNFEGLAVTYNPAGNVISSSRNPSVYGYNAQTGNVFNPNAD